MEFSCPPLVIGGSFSAPCKRTENDYYNNTLMTTNKQQHQGEWRFRLLNSNISKVVLSKE